LSDQIEIVGDDAAGQEVPLHPFHQRLDAALLIPGSRIAGLGMEAELGGELEQGWGPDRLVAGVTATGDGLHVVEDEHPGNKV
jgi:hypothetical protein